MNKSIIWIYSLVVNRANWLEFILNNRPFSLVHFVFPIQIMWWYSLRRFDSLSCSLKRVHADIFMLALMNKRIKSPEFHHMICFGKTKCTSEKGLLGIYISWPRLVVCWGQKVWNLFYNTAPNVARSKESLVSWSWFIRCCSLFSGSAASHHQ